MLIQTNKALVHNRRRENSGVYQVKSYLFIYLFLLQKVFFGILNAAVPQEVAAVLVVKKIKVLLTFQ